MISFSERDVGRVAQGDETVVPFVSMFYSSLSGYFWEDSDGTTHTIVQREGGEQGDLLMPLLFSFGQHPTLVAVQQQLREGEYLFAHLDVCMCGEALNC